LAIWSTIGVQSKIDKKAVLPQENRAMPQVLKFANNIHYKYKT